jgi:disease resistance protein RPM1
MEGLGAGHLVSSVGQLLGEEYRQLRGVGGQVAELRDELATMNAVLLMQCEAEDDGTVDHFVREWTKQVRELAYDTEDCIHLYIFRVRRRPKDRFLVRSKRLLETLFPRRRLAAEIKALRARAVAISARHARYGLSRPAASLAPAPAASAHALRPVSNDPDQLVGVSDQAKSLAEKLMAANDHERDMKLKVFSVVGFGGLGKTTLAMEVCGQLEADFQRQAQVSVSQAFEGRKDLKGLLKRVLRQIVKVKADHEKGIKIEDSLTRGEIDKMNLDDLVQELKDRLKDKRYEHYINN